MSRDDVFDGLNRLLEDGMTHLIDSDPYDAAYELIKHDPDFEGWTSDTIVQWVEEWQDERKPK